ncbi:DUF4238 domain-containing protein [Streptomyces sp. ICC4]|nr:MULTISPECIES: DUF4238 domain-containing protein [unclassified Streptomyces]
MDEWDIASADQSLQVGARHHTVPAFYLRRFGNPNEQLWVRDRRSPKAGLRKIADLAIKDFYTFINIDGEPDGRLEQLLTRVEGWAASALRRATSSVTWGSPVHSQDHADIALFMAFQYARGPRRRRELEVMSDLYTRLVQLNEPVHGGRREVAEYRAQLREFRELEFAAHPNMHLSTLSPLAQKLYPYFAERPLCVVSLTAGALVTCDEPIAAFREDGNPAPVLAPARQRVRTRRRQGARKARRATLFHVQKAGHHGLALADQIAMPVGRRTIIVMGDPEISLPSHVRLSPDESMMAAEALNRRLIEQTYFCAFSHPEDQHLLAQPLPELGPLFHLGGTRPEDGVIAANPLSHPRPQLFGRK